MIHRWSWGIAWTLFGIGLLPVSISHLGIVAGVAFIVAGISYIAGK